MMSTIDRTASFFPYDSKSSTRGSIPQVLPLLFSARVLCSTNSFYQVLYLLIVFSDHPRAFAISVFW